MNERVQRILDGDLPRSAASDPELADLAQAEALIGGVLRSIPVRPVPDLGPSVLHRIGALSTAPARQRNILFANLRLLLAWLWSPHAIAFHWRPAYALALGLLLLIPLLRDTTAPSTLTATHQVLVQFRLDAPDATGVALAGNFTNWKPKYELTRTAGGVWTVTVPLAQGVHNYAFVVDGKTWQADPLAPSVADGFGGENSQIAVLTPDVSAES